MKKFASLILALAVTFSLCTSAGAVAPDISALDGTDNEAVQVKVTTGEGGTIYHVTVNWDNLQFTYKRAASGSWDAENHVYENSNNAGWLVSGNQQIAAADSNGSYTAVYSAITVANHSNADVAVKATMNSTADKVSTNRGVTMTLSDADDTLDRADEAPYYGSYESADSAVYTLTVSGVPDNDTWGDDFVTLDHVIVAITAP